MARPLEFEDWMKANKKKVPTPADLLARSKGLASADPASVVDSTPEQVEEEMPEAPAIAKPEATASEGSSVNKDLLYQGIIAAAPLLVGYALGGNMGGAYGAKAGSDALTTMHADRKEKEKIAREQAEKKEKLDLSREALGVKKEQNKNTIELRKTISQRNQDNSDRTFQQREGVISTHDAEHLQKEYNKAMQGPSEVLGQITEARGIIASGKASDLDKVRLQLAAIFNKGRPTDKDVEPFKGSRAAFDKAERAVSAWLSNEATSVDVKELNRALDIMEATAKNRAKGITDQFTRQGSTRLRKKPEDIKSLLQPGFHIDKTDEEESVLKDKLIDDIMNGLDSLED